MKVKSRKLIEYYGIEDANFSDIYAFKEFNVSSIFNIDDFSKNIINIIKFSSTAKVNDYEIIKTPVGISLEGQILSGYKLLISGDLNLKYEYSDQNENLNTGYENIPFYVSVVLDSNVNLYRPMKVSFTVNDILCEKINYKTIYNSTSITVVVDVY